MYSILHWDTETHQIAPGRPAPRPVCLQWLGVRQADGLADGPHVLTGPDMLEWFAWALRSGALMSGLNCAYDLLVMIEAAITAGFPALDVWRLVFDWLSAGLCRCTEVRERLLRVALGEPDQGNLSMEAQAKKYLQIDLGDDKRGANAWRLRYGGLERWPTRDMLDCLRDPPIPEDCPADRLPILRARQAIAAEVREVLTQEQFDRLKDGRLEPGSLRPAHEWPPAAYRYAAEDPVHERGIYLGQQNEAIEVFGQPDIPDEVARAAAKFCLHLMASRGLRVDGGRARLAAASLDGALDLLRKALVREGLMREIIVYKGKPNERHDGYSKDTKLIQARVENALLAAGRPVKRTAPTPDRIHPKSGKVIPGKPHGQVSTDKEVLQLAELQADPGLRALVAFNGAEKLQATYIDPLCVDCGDPAPGWCGLTRPVHWRYDAVKDTGRTSAKRTSYTTRRISAAGDVELVTERDGNNVQNYPTESAIQAKGRDVLGVLGWGSPGDGVLADLMTEAERAAEAVLSEQEFKELRLRLWCRRHDVRPMVLARDGFALLNRDYSGVELATLAQCQVAYFGYEVTLAKLINQGLDVHCYVGQWVHELLWDESLDYETIVVEEKAYKSAIKKGKEPTDRQRRCFATRKLCKVVNFGFLGGMGAETFRQYVWQRERIVITTEQARALKSLWYEALPEMPQWFAYIGQQVDSGAPVVQLGSGRVRGGCTYTQNANTRFQGLAADGALNALFMLWRACLTDPTSPLFGSYPLVFEHDAFLVEVPHGLPPDTDAERALARAQELRRLGWWVARPLAANDPLAECYPAANGHLLPETDRAAVVALERVLAADDELERLMVAGMREFTPDVVIRTEGTAPSVRWEK